jgi:N-acetylglucosamine malate deacetylase 1
MRRRDLLGALGAGLPLMQTAAAQQRKLKVMAVGGHVDDPQSGCGGTLALYASLGHQAIAVSLTRGDSLSIAKSLGISNEELAKKRSADAIRSCDILKVRMIFLDQINGDTIANVGEYEKFGQFMREQNPDIVFAHWPLDTHRDHRTAAMLTYDSWVRGGKKFALYYFEVELGAQTQCFQPNHYVDITSVEALKREACFANTVTVKGWWPLHEQMQKFRGLERGCKAAEAFVHHTPSAVAPAPSKG